MDATYPGFAVTFVELRQRRFSVILRVPGIHSLSFLVPGHLACLQESASWLRRPLALIFLLRNVSSIDLPSDSWIYIPLFHVFGVDHSLSLQYSHGSYSWNKVFLSLFLQFFL